MINKKNSECTNSEAEKLRRELKQLKEEHALLKQKFNVYNDLAEEGLFIHENLIIKEANHAFEKLTGYSQEELIGMHGKEMLTPESVELIKKNINENNDGPIEVTMIAKDGSQIFAHTIGKTVSSGGETKRVVLVQNITQVKKAQKELEESEEKHRLISGLLSDYIYTCKIQPGKHPIIGWISGAMQNICGYSIEEVEKLENGWFTLIHPEDVQRIAQSAFINYSDDKIYHNEYRIIDRGGNIRWLSDRSMLIKYNEKTKEITLLGATKDVTEKKKVEQDLLDRNEDYKKLNTHLQKLNQKLSQANKQLVESEIKYKNLVESLVHGVGISYGEKILFANKALISMYGLGTFEEFASKELTEYMTEESKKQVKSRLANYEKDVKQDTSFRYQILRSDGAVRTLDITTNEIRYEGKICRQAIITDVTEQIESEEALLRAAHIFKNIQLGLFIYRLEKMDDDRSLRLVALNPESTRLIDIPEKNIKGKYIDDIFPNLRLNKIPQQYAEVVRTQIPVAIDDFYYEDERITKSSFSVKVFPLPNNCVGVSFENVSERRKAEQELRVRNHELNNFVYKVSHDLRAPLSSIKGLIHLSKLEENHADHLPKIEDRINHLDGFIRDILSHSRNLNTAVIVEKLDCQKIIEDCYTELEYLKGSFLINKTLFVKGGDFYNDKIRFYEICRNMISNAIKYQDYDKKERFLQINANISPQYMTITFKDNGIGIEPELEKSIFKMFFRATAISEGSGIGLYIVKQAIEKLNGSIRVASTPTEGTNFTVKLPNLILKKQD